MSDFVPLPHSGRSGGSGENWQRRPGRGNRGGGRGTGGRGRGRGRFHGSGRHGQGRGHNNLQRGSRASVTPEILGTPSDSSLCVAVQGCCHGELDSVYKQLQAHEERTGQKVDLLLCCGDFQSLRNVADYHSLAVPPKYRRLGTFCQYYSGELQAPVLTVFIGGNHEASQPLHELYYGGWVAPNIYYLGAAGVINVRGVRIGGISGIYKSHDYSQGRFERPPYDRSSMRSVYHVRNVDVYRMKCLSSERARLGIMLSHDWPQGIEQSGDTEKLLRQKPFFRDEVRRNELGSPPNRELLEALRPQWWFSAHLHVKFKAVVTHATLDRVGMGVEGSAKGLIPSQVASSRTYSEDHEETEVAPPSTEFISLESSNRCAGPDLTQQMTQFLALDKCLPRRQHLSIVHVPCETPNGPALLRYDPEWLAILKKTHSLTESMKRKVRVPPSAMCVSEDEIAAIVRRLADQDVEGRDPDDPLVIPNNFRMTVPPHHDQCWRGNPGPLAMMGNPLTDELMSLLELRHIITMPYAATDDGVRSSVVEQISREPFPEDENEIDLDGDEVTIGIQSVGTCGIVDDNEIELEEDSGGGGDDDDKEEQKLEQPTDAVAPSTKKARLDTEKVG